MVCWYRLVLTTAFTSASSVLVVRGSTERRRTEH